ncbi:MAG: hypothetical protein HY960_03225 [Ignavibacteriae bacterium]|nr:hypothetical protein [Ignavibacteriota bacterium]
MKRTAVTIWTDLTKVLSPIEWAVVGAVATRHYMPERMTQDLDAIISLEDANEAREKLLKARFTFEGELTIGGSTWKSPKKKYIDLLESDAEWISDAIKEAQKNRDLQGLPILPFRFLVLMKFQAGRPQDLADISRMLGQADVSLIRSTKKVFQEWQPDGLKDLQQLLKLGQLEIR